MNVESHIRNIRESVEVIEESIKAGIVERQRTIGFHCSSASVDMLELFLHKNNLIDPGHIIKHEWFASKNKLRDKFPFDFPSKKELFSLMSLIEEKRNLLCYGKPQKEETISEVIKTFNNLRKKFRELGLDEI